MKFTNFELCDSVTLSGLGTHWDLHNFADFAGLELLPAEGSVILRWAVTSEAVDRGEGFSRTNPAKRCAIRFDAVEGVWATRVKLGTGLKDAKTVHELGLVLPISETPKEALELGIRVPATGQGGNVFVMFMDGFNIEIAASEASLEADSMAHDNP